MRKKLLMEMTPRRASDRIASKVQVREEEELQEENEKQRERERQAEERKREEEERQREKQQQTEKRQQGQFDGCDAGFEPMCQIATLLSLYDNCLLLFRRLGHNVLQDKNSLLLYGRNMYKKKLQLCPICYFSILPVHFTYCCFQIHKCGANMGNKQCAVPEKNPYMSLPQGGSLEIPRGRGVLKDKILEAKYEAKLEFPGGRQGFWNCTIPNRDNFSPIRCVLQIWGLLSTFMHIYSS